MMILNCYFRVSSSATGISQDSNQQLQPSSPTLNARQTKILLPNKKPEKWSTGVAPGEYGGPPVTTKLRKYWGGEKEDPITSSDFIWNNDFMDRMEKFVQEQPEPSRTVEEEPSGFLSLHRVMSLESLDTDLSTTLTSPHNVVTEQETETIQGEGKSRKIWKLAPTRREQEKWDRATKAATGGSDVMFRDLRRPRGDPQVLAAQSRRQYNEIKKKLQILTLGIGSIGLVSAYVSYSPEIAASFGAGFLGSLIYIRMLGNSVDSMASEGARGAIKGAVGQPRLLVPVALVMIYNRWNGLAVPEYGLMHLELIPMLVGFFTYKIATFAQAIEEALFIMRKNSED